MQFPAYKCKPHPHTEHSIIYKDTYKFKDILDTLVWGPLGSDEIGPGGSR